MIVVASPLSVIAGILCSVCSTSTRARCLGIGIVTEASLTETVDSPPSSVDRIESSFAEGETPKAVATVSRDAS